MHANTPNAFAHYYLEPLPVTKTTANDLHPSHPDHWSHTVAHAEPLPAPGQIHHDINGLLILAHEQAAAHTYDAFIDTCQRAATRARQIQLETLADAAGVVRH